MALPDFLIIGAMKCGTTTLQAQLALQDGVFMTTPKEPNFFSDDAVYARGQVWYESLFADAAEGALKGEASTHYTKLPTYPKTMERMQTLLPAPKLIYMIRNPVARAVSHYLHEWSQGVMGDDAAAAFRRHPEIVAYGCYGMQIAPYVAAYGAERIFLTSLEQVEADPDGEFERICQFLGLSGQPRWVHDLPPQNVSRERIRRLPFHDLLVDNPVATALRRTLVPKSLRRRIRDARRAKERPQIPSETKAVMVEAFRADRQALAAIFPGHPALRLSYPFL